MDTFRLEILTPQRIFYAGECLSLVLPISDGMLGIMAHHTPLMAAILDGEVRFITPGGQWTVCAVTSGMINMEDNRARLLCESALTPEEIDEDAERLYAEKALTEMKKKQSKRDFALWQMTFNKAINNLRVKHRSM